MRTDLSVNREGQADLRLKKQFNIAQHLPWQTRLVEQKLSTFNVSERVANPAPIRLNERLFIYQFQKCSQRIMGMT